jgi:hypothetical protein
MIIDEGDPPRQALTISGDRGLPPDRDSSRKFVETHDRFLGVD